MKIPVAGLLLWPISACTSSTIADTENAEATSGSEGTATADNGAVGSPSHPAVVESTPPQHDADEPSDDETPSLPPPNDGEENHLLIDIDWDAVPSPTSQSTVADSILTLLVRSQAEAPIEVQAYVMIDGGTSDTIFAPIDVGVLDAGDEVALGINPSTYDIDLAAMPYSGLVHVVVSAKPVDLDLPWQSLTTQDLYYHPLEDGGVLAYGPTVLRAEYASGDFRGTLEAEQSDDAEGRLRVIGGDQ